MEEDPTKKAERKSTRLGPTGEAVRANVRRLRDAQGMSAAQLSAQLGQLGRPIPLIGIQRIESGERRPDTDELVALAVALGVSPASLLMPNLETVAKDDLVPISGWRKEISATVVWRWLTATSALVYGTDASFIARALPSWEREERMRPIMFPGEVQADGDD